jgi:NAD(P)-dependent dehydrogenase (short-subunit alcohol dehydrogenase family)
MNLDKKDKVIIILGSNGRIGNSLIDHLNNNKNKIVAVDIKKKINLDKSIIQIQSDVSIEKNIKNIIKITNQRFKRIDHVINCTYPSNRNWGKSFEKISKKDLNQHFTTHLTDLIVTTRNFTKYFINQKYGNMIFLSSIQGLGAPKFEHYKNTNMSSCLEYSIIKAGVINMTKYLAKYFKNKNIRFNCISIGGIVNNQPKIFKKRYKESCLSKGLLDPKDIHSAFDYLISSSSIYVNGQNIIVDDGWSL